MNWGQHIGQRRTERIAAMAAEEQAIRDAAADGFPITGIATALGQKNRQSIYATLRRGRDSVSQPAATPTVYLRAGHRKGDLWQAVEQAMWLRGWRTEHDRTAAWHAARAGLPVVLCDFTLGEEVVVLVEARYDEEDPRELRLPRRGIAIEPASKPRETLPDRLAYAVAQVLGGVAGQAQESAPAVVGELDDVPF